MTDRGAQIIDLHHNSVATQAETQSQRLLRILSRAGGRIDTAARWFDQQEYEQASQQAREADRREREAGR